MNALQLIVVIAFQQAISCFFIYKFFIYYRYRLGCQLLFDLKLPNAIIIFEKLFENHPNAPALLAECKYRQGINAKEENEAVDYFNQAMEINRRLPRSANRSYLKYIK